MSDTTTHATDSLEIVDTHFHLWDPANTQHPLRPIARLFGRFPRLYQWVCERLVPKDIQMSLGSVEHMIAPYLPRDFQSDIGDHNVTSCVFMPYAWDANSDVEFAGEVEFAESAFSSAGDDVNVRLGALVGQAHLRNQEDLPCLIEAYKSASPQLVGLREMLSWSDDNKVTSYADAPHLTTDTKWRAGFETLATKNLLFEAWGYHTQLEEIAALANAFPTTSIVLAHMGTPVGAMGPVGSYGDTADGRRDLLLEWEDGISRVAENKNVTVKLSGLFMPAMGWGFHDKRNTPDNEEIVDRLKPLIDHAVSQFGVDRCMFGSHCPPDKVSLSYAQTFDIYKQVVSDRPIAEQRQLFSETAKRTYRIST